MKFNFLHNHYIPAELKNGTHQVESVIVPEFYPDLNIEYLGKPCYFNSVESYIKYVVQHGYYSSDTSYSIENNRIINPKQIRVSLPRYKELGVKIIQLYCGTDNHFFTNKYGLTYEGKQLLTEISKADLILDLSHLSDDNALLVASIFNGRMIVSHCACSDLYSSMKPRSNSLVRSSINILSKRIELFGISFLNDIIAASENELNSTKIFNDIIEQIHFFIDIAGIDRIALSPDYIDTNYFSKRYNTELIFPDSLMTQKGLHQLIDKMSVFLSQNDIIKIVSGNVEKLLHL